jgi:AcrR family transcriptional regulator
MRREDQRRQTNQRIREAARRRFEADGPEVTVAAIAADAGVSAGNVMAHFPTKEALLAAAFEDALDVVLATAALDRPEAVLPSLLHDAQALYAWYRRRPDLSKTLIRFSMFADGPEGARLMAHADAYVVELADRLAAGQRRGEVRADVPPMVGAIGWFGDYLLCNQGGLSGRLGTIEDQLTLLDALTRFRLAPLPRGFP